MAGIGQKALLDFVEDCRVRDCMGGGGSHKTKRLKDSSSGHTKER